MMLDLKPVVLEALRSPEGRDLIRRLVTEMQPADERPGDLVDAKEAARLLGMTAAAVRQAARRGTFSPVYLGRRVRFRLADLLALSR